MDLPDKETLLKLYRDLLTARRVEARIFEIVTSRGGSGGHRGPGEEVIPIAFCNNLRETDCIHPNFRTFFCLFAKPPFELTDTVAMYLGKVYRNLPVMSPRYGTIGSSGTLGEPAVMYLGTALASSIQKTGDVTVFVQGDGASNRAPTHEAMVVAAAWNLPIIFVIQNNRYGMGTAVEKVYTIDDLSLRGVGYGMPHESVDGNDMIAMYLTARRHVERCRAGGGPSLIAANTYRLRPHYEGDPQIYRPKGQMEDWQQFDPLPRYTKQLMDLGVIDEEYVQRLEGEVAAEIDEAVARVESLPGRRSYEDLEKTAIAEL